MSRVQPPSVASLHPRRRGSSRRFGIRRATWRVPRNPGRPQHSGRDLVMVGQSARPLAPRHRGGHWRTSRAPGARSIRGLFARACRRTCGAPGKIVPAPLRHIFFSDDGSTAVEVALKMAVQFWSNCGHPEKRRIVALEHAYHGDTVGAMSVSDDSPFTAAFDSSAGTRAANAFRVSARIAPWA